MSGYGSYGGSSSYGSSPSFDSGPSSFGGDSQPQQRVSRDELEQQLQQQIAVSQTQVLMQRMSETCFAKCVTKPSSTLSSSDKNCITRCADRYFEAFAQVQRSYLEALQHQ
ncbi:hypothetical protein PTSG_06603 [Salpingoeca rosetta]|uniref:Mitochondrial import inner membrane translocase subunit n=1 Tax=Salpingoeca rosetta (strain ATCC 50818 / BSB-021) TaxID=946362 RepID=F2UFG5_SALR5|nr:uncharacterized protein PTSG_06603 [Salpingoeca rosetta]EGD75533.1 hypothetical protein PTSG_06603 [Salpingoeca rosetta]|eukprot:XP_004991990.1 hypothetical protein PTSG_06603 [Salpingoeca rosetta]